MLTTSIILSGSRAEESFADALHEIAKQKSQAEYIIVASDTAQNRALAEQSFEGVRWQFYRAAENPVDALNAAFARANGDLLAWLGDNELLCAWALPVVSIVLERLPEVRWVTSSALWLWSDSHIPVQAHMTQGFSRDTFFRGRNLKSSPHFAYPISRAGTFWRRTLWDQSGGTVHAPLARAGDFELWTRFWDVAALASLPLPLGGRLATRKDDAPDYWDAAQAILNLQAPRQAAPDSARALSVCFAAQGKQCVLKSHPLP